MVREKAAMAKKVVLARRCMELGVELYDTYMMWNA
jgi:hypothetical protein